MSNILERLAELLSDKQPVPNRFTVGMGQLVRQAREEAGLSQADLAKGIYRRRATVSDIENGKSEVGTTTLALIAGALDKPITYFLPPEVRAKLKPDDLDTEEQELLIQFRKIWDQQLKRLAIRQVQTMAESDIQEYRKQLQAEVEENPYRE